MATTLPAVPAFAFDPNNPRVVGAGPRPVPPAEEPGAFDLRVNCTAEPEKAAADMARMMEHPESWFARVEAMGQHGERMMIWYNQQFIRQGAWTEAEAEAFSASLAERPEMADTVAWLTGMMTGMFEDLARIVELDQRGDKIAACRAFEGMMGRLADMPTRIRDIWSAIDRIYAAEAEREGITLPQ